MVTAVSLVASDPAGAATVSDQVVPLRDEGARCIRTIPAPRQNAVAYSHRTFTNDRATVVKDGTIDDCRGAISRCGIDASRIIARHGRIGDRQRSIIVDARAVVRNRTIRHGHCAD